MVRDSAAVYSYSASCSGQGESRASLALLIQTGGSRPGADRFPVKQTENLDPSP